MKFTFTEAEERLLAEVRPEVEYSNLWELHPEKKIGALVDIYGGFYPEVFERNEELVLEYFKKLVDFCETYSRLLPETKEENASAERMREIEVSPPENSPKERDDFFASHCKEMLWGESMGLSRMSLYSRLPNGEEKDPQPSENSGLRCGKNS